MNAIRNRVTLTLDDDTYELLQRLSKQTGMTPAAMLTKLIPAHLEELWAYLEWMEQLPEGANPRRHRGAYLIQSYGPKSLIADIKELDPSYKTAGERFVEGIREPRKEGGA